MRTAAMSTAVAVSVVQIMLDVFQHVSVTKHIMSKYPQDYSQQRELPLYTVLKTPMHFPTGQDRELAN